MFSEQFDQLRIEIQVAPVEAPFALFQVQIKCSVGDAVELLQPPSGEAPKILYRLKPTVFGGLVFNPVGLLVFDIHQPVVTMPAVIEQHFIRHMTTTNDGAQGGLTTVRDDLRVDSIVVDEQGEDGFSGRRAAPASSADAERTGVALGPLDPSCNKRRVAQAVLCDALSNLEKDAGRALARQAGKLG